MNNIISAVQINSGNDVAANLHKAACLIQRAAEEGANLIVLPEMFACMGSRKDINRSLQRSYDDAVFLAIREMAVSYGVWILAGALPFLDSASLTCSESRDGTVSETASASTQVLPSSHSALINDAGEVVECYEKIHLFDVQVDDGIGAYCESDTFRAGNRIVVCDSPVGRLGWVICYDLRFPELFRAMFEMGVDVIAVPSAFTQITGQAHWQLLLQARAIENSCYIIGANQCGVHADGRETYGHSQIIDPWGVQLATLKTEEGVVSAQVSAQHLADIRSRMPCRQHKVLSITKPDEWE